MRETQFIQQNKDKWSKFERDFERGNSNPDELSDLFIELTDDLSYSRTFYPNRSVRVYLNNIAQKVFKSVYKQRVVKGNRFVNFWIKEAPQIIYESRKAFIFSGGIFLLGLLIGFLSTFMDTDFAAVMLGKDYVEDIYNSIDIGKPMAIYEGGSDGQSFVGFALNNIRIAINTFVFGLFLGIGTLFILLRNGIAIGALQALYIKEGVIQESILTIGTHTSLEIPCIIIAGAAGLSLGSGLVFPGTYSRVQSLQLSARRGLQIMFMIIPLVILAALVEGFITGAGILDIVRVGVILLNLCIVLGFFVVLPKFRAKKGFTSFLNEAKLSHDEQVKVDFKRVKTGSQIFSDAFLLYRKYFKYITVLALAMAVVYSLLLPVFAVKYKFTQPIGDIPVFEGGEAITEWGIQLFSNVLQNISQFFIHETYNISWLITFITLSIMMYFSFFWVCNLSTKERQGMNKQTVKFYINTISSTLLLSALGNALITTQSEFFFLIGILLLPLLFFTLSFVFNESKNIVTAFTRALSIIGGNWTNLYSSYFMALAMIVVFFLVASAPISEFYFGITASIMKVDNILAFRTQFYLFLYTYMINVLSPLLFMVISIGSFSFVEQKEANNLLNKIETIGIQKQSYGMIKES